MTYKKLEPLKVIGIVLMAISISLLNLEAISWNTNIKSYLGLIAFAIVLALFFYRQSIETHKH